MEITGKLVEIGNLESNAGRGVAIETNQDTYIEISGFTESECQELAVFYAQKIKITITKVD